LTFLRQRSKIFSGTSFQPFFYLPIVLVLIQFLTSKNVIYNELNLPLTEPRTSLGLYQIVGLPKLGHLLILGDFPYVVCAKTSASYSEDMSHLRNHSCLNFGLQMSQQLHATIALSRGKNPLYPRDRRLCGSQSQSGCMRERKISYPYPQKKPDYNMLNSLIPSRTTRNNLTHTIKISFCPGNKFTTSHGNIVIDEIYSRFLQHQYSSLRSIMLDVLLLLQPEPVAHTQHIPVTKTFFCLSAYFRENVSITRHYAARSYTNVGLLYKECYFCSILTKRSLFTTAL